MAQGVANATASLSAFEKILDLASNLKTGFIVLEHDLYQVTVDMAIGFFLTIAEQRHFLVRLFAGSFCLQRVRSEEFSSDIENSYLHHPPPHNSSNPSMSAFICLSPSSTSRPLAAIPRPSQLLVARATRPRLSSLPALARREPRILQVPHPGRRRQ